VASLAVRPSTGSNTSMMMDDEPKEQDDRKLQDEPQDKVQATEELSDEQLDQIAGGNVAQMAHETKKSIVQNLRG
jgi:hypothetical protein